MKTKIYQFLFLMMMAISFSFKLVSQTGTLTLTFTGDNNGQPVNLESVWVKNLTQNCDTTLYPPDFTLVIDTILTGISNPANSGSNFTVSQNYPNPFIDQTSISIYLPEKDHLEIRVCNLLGQQIAIYCGQLNSGINTFRFFPGDESIYLLSVNDGKSVKTIQLLQAGEGSGQSCRLEYTGNGGSDLFKSAHFKNYFDFNPGDQLLFVGHSASEETGITDSPTENKNYEFQFATNIPCPGLDSLFYEDRYYHTVQIFSQCWMKENLDAGTMIYGSQSQTNNGIIEKYCYANNQNNCTHDGGLYLWEEMMQYDLTTEGAQGICPEGWHVPTDGELKILEGAADSQYTIGHQIWNSNTYRGFDAGKNLKSTSGWFANGNGIDLYGFGAVGAGYWFDNGFSEQTVDGIYGTSSLTNELKYIFRAMNCYTDKVARGIQGDYIVGISVRCLKNQE